MTVLEAMTDGLTRMARVLDAKKRIDADFVRDYLFVIEDDHLGGEDVDAAAAHFCRLGNGFPTGPMFRAQCLHERWRRTKRLEAENYTHRKDAEAETEAPMDPEEARGLIRRTLARMQGGMKMIPGDERPRDLRPQIRQLKQEAEARARAAAPSDTSKAGDVMETAWGGQA